MSLSDQMRAMALGRYGPSPAARPKPGAGAPDALAPRDPLPHEMAEPVAGPMSLEPMTGDSIAPALAHDDTQPPVRDRQAALPAAAPDTSGPPEPTGAQSAPGDMPKPPHWQMPRLALLPVTSPPVTSPLGPPAERPTLPLMWALAMEEPRAHPPEPPAAPKAASSEPLPDMPPQTADPDPSSALPMPSERRAAPAPPQTIQPAIPPLAPPLAADPLPASPAIGHLEIRILPPPAPPAPPPVQAKPAPQRPGGLSAASLMRRSGFRRF